MELFMVGRQKKLALFSDNRVQHKGHARLKRIADLIKHEISLLLVHRTKDPRLLNVSIVEVRVSRDLRHARIFYSVLGDERKVREAKQGLLSARGFIRSHLAETLDLRVTPELVFERDLSLVRQQEMEELFKELAGERPTTD